MQQAPLEPEPICEMFRQIDGLLGGHIRSVQDLSNLQDAIVLRHEVAGLLIRLGQDQGELASPRFWFRA